MCSGEKMAIKASVYSCIPKMALQVQALLAKRPCKARMYTTNILMRIAMLSLLGLHTVHRIAIREV